MPIIQPNLLSWEDEKKCEEDEVHGGIIGRGGTLINNPLRPLIMGPVIQPLIPLYHFQCWIWCPPTPPLLAPTPPVLNTLSTTFFHWQRLEFDFEETNGENDEGSSVGDWRSEGDSSGEWRREGESERYEEGGKGVIVMDAEGEQDDQISMLK